MDRQYLRYLQLTFQVLDLFILNCVIIGFIYLFESKISTGFGQTYFYLFGFLNVSWVVLSWVSHMYAQAFISSFESFARKTTRLYIVWLCSVMAYLFLFHQYELSRLFIVGSLGAFGVGLSVNRFFYIIIRNLSQKDDRFTKRILILGYNATGRHLSDKLEKNSNNKIVGYVDDPELITELTPYPIRGNIEETISLSEALNVNQIFSTVSPEQNHHIYRLMREAESKFILFRIVPDLSFFIKKSVHVEFFEGLPMLALREEPLEDTGNRIKKRGMDLVISFFVVVFVLSWLVPLLGLLIFLESPGPIFFSQWRSGRNNKPFRCFKFRSMKMNKEADHLQASKEDERLTVIGKFIRKTSLDEFPQFINVLKGEMSLVGPRPHMLKHTEEYSKIVEQYMIRQFLKPGITGWAQINGYRGGIHDDEQITGRVECDLWYSEHWNPWLDFKILFYTGYNIFKGEKNAY